MGILSALIPAAGSIIGGMMQSKAAKSANQANLEQARLSQQEAIRQFNLGFHSTIQARVADAKKAGIHPLYALGAPGTSPTAQFIPGQAQTGSHMGDAVAAASGAIGDAFLKKGGPSPIQTEQLEGLRLDNQFKRTQVKAAEAELRAKGITTGTMLNALPPGRTFVGNDIKRTKEKTPAGHPPLFIKTADGYEVVNPHYQLDELAQMIAGQRIASTGARKKVNAQRNLARARRQVKEMLNSAKGRRMLQRMAAAQHANHRGILDRSGIMHGSRLR